MTIIQISEGTQYLDFATLSGAEYKCSLSTAQKYLGGKKKITKEDLMKLPVFKQYAEDKNFNKMLKMFGKDIDETELSFLVTAMDASIYRHGFSGNNSTDPDDHNIENINDKDKDITKEGFYLDKIYSTPGEVMEFSKKDFKDYKKGMKEYKC